MGAPHQGLCIYCEEHRPLTSYGTCEACEGLVPHLGWVAGHFDGARADLDASVTYEDLGLMAALPLARRKRLG